MSKDFVNFFIIYFFKSFFIPAVQAAVAGSCCINLLEKYFSISSVFLSFKTSFANFSTNSLFLSVFPKSVNSFPQAIIELQFTLFSVIT